MPSPNVGPLEGIKLTTPANKACVRTETCQVKGNTEGTAQEPTHTHTHTLTITKLRLKDTHTHTLTMIQN